MKGQFPFLGNNNILVIHYLDKKEIYFLSTIHDTESSTTGKADKNGVLTKNLQPINDYNKFIDGVSKNDATVHNYSCVQNV